MVISTAWLLFARAASYRFPNKCYQQLNGVTTIEHIVLSLQKCGVEGCDIFLCTSINTENDDLVYIAERMGIRHVRGSEEYPLMRILMIHDKLDAYDKVVRICGDSPLYQPSLALKSIQYDLDNKMDFITNTRRKNFPSGQSIEVYKAKSMLNLIADYDEVQREEHMSLIFKHPGANKWLIGDIYTNEQIPAEFNVKLTLDEIHDYHFLKNLSQEGTWEKASNFYSSLAINVFT